MDLERVRELCLAMPGVEEDFPFDEDTLAFKVLGKKIFLLTNVERYPSAINVKCRPELAVTLRERYPAVQPGYHMNKKHWNTIVLDGTVPDDELAELIQLSYELVTARMTRADRQALEALGQRS